MSTVTQRKPRRRWRIIAILLAVMIAVTGFAVWYIHNRIDQSGERISIVWPAQPVGAAFGGALAPVDVDGDLAATGARAESIQIMASEESAFFVSRQRISQLMWLTAGKERLETTRLGFVLFSKDGDEIGHGVMQPPVGIAPGQTVSTEVVHPRITEAARIEIRKLP